MKSKEQACCNIGGIITIDERGQMVLPKDVRERMNIKAGEKFAVAVLESNSEPYCIALIKTETIEGLIKNLLLPTPDGNEEN